MAEDIRREVGDVRPNTFIREGVVDSSVATALEGVGTAAITIDTGLAKRRLATATDMLAAQYVVGSPAAGELVEDSPTDDVKLDPSDNRSLKDFQGVLDTMNGARDQGRMNADSYQLRGERLLKIAIAKRPGLAQEFRSIAAQHLGVDVMGAEARFLMNKEDELAKATAAGAKAEKDDKWKLYNDDVQLFSSQGMGGYAQFDGPDDPAYQQWKNQNLPIAMKRQEADSRTKMAESQAKYNGATKEVQLDANNAVWAGKFDTLLADIPIATEAVFQKLKAEGADKDPVAVRSALNTVLTGFDSRVTDLNVAAANGTVSPEVRELAMKRMQEQRDRVATVLSSASDKELIENYTSALKGGAALALYTNKEFLDTTTLFENLPPAVANVVATKMDKQLTIMASQMLQETAAPEVAARKMPEMVDGFVVALFPDGGVTAPDPVAVGKFSKVLSEGAAAFLTQGDDQFKAETFTRNPVTNKAGFLQKLDNHMGILEKQLPETDRQELGVTVAAAASNSYVVLGRSMKTKYPTLAGKVDVNFDAPGGQPFVLKAGVKPESLTVVERQGLTAYNRAANAPLVQKVVQRLLGLKSPTESAMVLRNTFAQGQSAAKTASAARRASPAPSGGGSSPYPDGTRLQGPDGVYVVRGGQPVKE